MGWGLELRRGHCLDVGRRQGHVVDLHLVDQPREEPAIERVGADDEVGLGIERADVRMGNAVVEFAVDVNGDRPGLHVPHGRDVHPLARDEIGIGVHGQIGVAAGEGQLGAEGRDDEVVGDARDIGPEDAAAFIGLAAAPPRDSRLDPARNGEAILHGSQELDVGVSAVELEAVAEIPFAERDAPVDGPIEAVTRLVDHGAEVVKGVVNNGIRSSDHAWGEHRRQQGQTSQNGLCGHVFSSFV